MALPTTYDTLINRYRGSVPIAFVKALMKGESGFRPNGQTGSYRGLMQVGKSVLQDYNSRNGTQITAEQLFDPETNIRVGCQTLNRIVSGYDGHRTLRQSWHEGRYAALFMFGWNAGYSNGGGVGYVAGVLESKGYTTEQVTVDSVSKAAGDGTAPRASVHLTSAAKVAYCKKVARWYLEEASLPQDPSVSSGGALDVALDLADETGLYDFFNGDDGKLKMAGVIAAGIFLLA